MISFTSSASTYPFPLSKSAYASFEKNGLFGIFFAHSYIQICFAQLPVKKCMYSTQI